MKKVLILGVNGFIGHHLSKRILETTDWHVYGMDMMTDRITDILENEAYKSRMHFFEGDITINQEWVEYHVKKCDVILPLVAIATPSTYVNAPLRVFELDFEANLPIVRSAAKYKKHLVFPSTSEVYGMCHDEEFDPEESELICGPINKPRWIYSCAKQLMDRVIWGYGMEAGLNFTLFRPFNWIGAGLDSIHTPKEGSSRVVTQFFGHIVRGENISLVDGGLQKRAFTYIDDGIDALMKIIANGPVVKVQDGEASVMPRPAIMRMRSPQCCSATRSRRSQMLCDKPAAAKKNSLTLAKNRARNSASCSSAPTSSSQPLGTVR